MNFTSAIFLIGLLPLFLILYYSIGKNLSCRKALILIANSVFYIWCGGGVFLFLILYSTVIWIICTTFKRHKSKALFALGCAIATIPLLITKYTSFAIECINGWLSLNAAPVSIVVPLGISFFSFEAISCIVDVYHDKIEKQLSIMDVYLYLSFFPTVTSGPIMRISGFVDCYDTEIQAIDINGGVSKFVIGAAKKLLIADNISIIADYYFNGCAAGKQFSICGLWIGSIAYTFQLFFDFSGYSDMAIGIGELLGFHIPKNFDRPYSAVSIKDFWRRWHISLSTWFKDYIYIPLGGNRCSNLRLVRNLFCVWLLTGIWHGADWTFVIWGLGYFLLLLGERFVPFIKQMAKKWYGRIYTLFFVNLLWVPFRANDVSVAGKYLSGMFGLAHYDNSLMLERKAIRFIPLLFLGVLLCLPWSKYCSCVKDRKWFKAAEGIGIIALAIFVICATVNSSYTPYIYGQF